MNAPPHSLNGSYRILVVDDDPGVLSVARAILVGVGFAVIPAGSAELALSICREETLAGREISLIVLDLTLPGGMTGLEMLDCLKQVDSGVRVIASSGYFDESAAQAAQRRGFIGILPKPYSAEKLIKVVNWALGRSHKESGFGGELPEVSVRPDIEGAA